MTSAGLASTKNNAATVCTSISQLVIAYVSKVNHTTRRNVQSDLCNMHASTRRLELLQLDKTHKGNLGHQLISDSDQLSPSRRVV